MPFSDNDETPWREIIEQHPVGFMLGEVVRNAANEVIDFRYLTVNAAWETLTGMSREQAIGRTIRELIPDLEPHWIDNIATVVETKTPSTFVQHSAALRRWYECNVYNTAPERFAISFLDVTARRAAHDVVAADAERQRLFLQQMPGFVAVLTGPDHLFTYVNDAYVAIAGSRDYIGHGVREVFPELVGQGFFELLDKVYSSGEPFVAKAIPVQLANQSDNRFIDLLYQPIHDDNGRTIGIFVGGYDITERISAERALQFSETRYRTIFETMDEGFCIIEFFDGPHGPLSDYIHIEANRAYALHAGIPNVVGQTLRKMVPDEADGWVERYGAVLRTGVPIRFERELVKTGRYLELAAFRIEPSSLRQVAVLFQDVTARKRAETVLREVNETLEARVNQALTERNEVEEALRQSQKMEAVGQLTGGLAHDFNNLLAGISGSLELMQTRISQGRHADVERYIIAAQGASRRAAALTHRLLAFSRRQTLDPRPTNVNRLVTGMEEMIRRTIGPSIHLEVVGASGLWPALVDPSQLENALLNLCINARDAMPEGGRITIETANKWLDRSAARRHDVPEGQYLSLCVTDTGTGMTPETIEHVFEPFFTTKPIGEGTGLGLSMIYGFAKQSGGQVRIYSEVGEGTTVCIYLPRYHGQEDVEEESLKPTELARSGQSKTVLVVDDEPTVRMLIGDILEELGYQAIEATDSAVGLRILQSEVRIDLLVTDVGLPGGMNGRQMADAARVSRPDLRVLFITGYAENSVLGNGQLAPGMAVLTKPFPIETMAERIREMIEAGSDSRMS